MNNITTLRIATLSPIRSPISAYSEQRAASTPEHLPDTSQGANQHLLPPSEALSRIDWPWANGYGTLAHDSLPKFFLPFDCYNIDTTDCVAHSSNLRRLVEDWRGEIETCQLFLYDDTVALLRLDVVISVDDAILDELTASGSLDKTLSDGAGYIHKTLLYPIFQTYCKEFDRRFGKSRSAPDQLLRNPNKLTVFKDIHFKEPTAPESHVLWTGRSIIIKPEKFDSPTGDTLRQRVSFPGTIDDLRQKRHHVGSGNVLVISEDAEASRDDWFRGLSLCQYYNAILAIYSRILKSSYSQLTDLLGAQRTRNGELNRLMADITQSLDHLEFSRLEFNEARVGVQGDRAAIVNDSCAAWKLDGLIQSALERTDLIRSRIARLLAARKSRVDKTVELILAGIGGVALVELFISLTTASRSLPKDDFPGLLDVFLWMPPNGAIALSSLLLMVIFIYIYIAKR
ncbi:hypothetical protein [Marinobacter sp. DY40_1A1]|uniref:hypothetical protein n=1 Tax=Marinobacter sp. DY40_1A1 TaxID=2583229 RepID=UPI0019052E31|nr:hypothetical protein [Marinobacter sp. DY40_1A1]MBK1885661.1 hypothetical protein [Marinobacter sp. DY40_1A1]